METSFVESDYFWGYIFGVCIIFYAAYFSLKILRKKKELSALRKTIQEREIEKEKNRKRAANIKAHKDMQDRISMKEKKSIIIKKSDVGPNFGNYIRITFNQMLSGKIKISYRFSAKEETVELFVIKSLNRFVDNLSDTNSYQLIHKTTCLPTSNFYKKGKINKDGIIEKDSLENVFYDKPIFDDKSTMHYTAIIRQTTDLPNRKYAQTMVMTKNFFYIDHRNMVTKEHEEDLRRQQIAYAEIIRNDSKKRVGEKLTIEKLTTKEEIRKKYKSNMDELETIKTSQERQHEIDIWLEEIRNGGAYSEAQLYAMEKDIYKREAYDRDEEIEKNDYFK